MININRKGAEGELEFAKYCHGQGFDKVRRTAQYCGITGEAADVIGLPGIHAEVKRVERLNLYEAIEQAKRDSKKSGRVPVVFHRKNYREWLVTMTADDWFNLYRESELLNSNYRSDENGRHNI
jgi:Holliday junction resolvase